MIRNKKDDFFELFDNVNAARCFIGAGATVVKKRESRIAGEKKPAYVKKGRKESALSYMKELILSHNTSTDQQIVDLVKKRFPNSNYNASMVKFNRKKLMKKN